MELYADPLPVAVLRDDTPHAFRVDPFDSLVPDRDRDGGLGYQPVGAGPIGQLQYDTLPKQRLPFVRWETIDTQNELPAGFSKGGSRERDLLTIGLSFKPIDQLVIKADWRNEDDQAGTGVDQFNLGLGYIF